MDLVGRREALTAADEVLASGSGALVVEGPAGIGKSRLLKEAAGLARARGMAVAYGRATELDRVAPLSTLLRALGRLGEPPGGFDALGWAAEVVARAAGARPTAIVLDDAQWADELTCLALRHLVPEPAGAPVVWLLGRRPFPAQPAIDALVSDGARRVPLAPLGEDEAAEFCARLLGARPGPSVLNLARAAGGNPFLLEEALNGLRAEGRVVVSGGVATIEGAGPPSSFGAPVERHLPAGFGAAVERRLRDLPAGTRRLLEAGAVLRRPFTVHEAAGVLGMPPGALLPDVRAAVRAQALVEDGDRLAFRHDLIREALYDGLPAAVRAALHREAAAVLRLEGSPAAELAEHLRHGARAGDVAAIRELRAAAEDMTAAAPSAAADLMLRALELARPAEPGTPAARERQGLAAGVVRLLASAGRLAEAREVADAPDAGLGPAEAAGVTLGLAEALKHAGDDHGVIRRTGRALERAGVPVRERARLLAVRAHALMTAGEIDAADRAAAEAVAAGEPFAQVVGLQARSAVALTRGEPREALEHARRAVALADAAGGEAAHRHPRLWLGAALTALDRFEEAQEAYAVVGRESGRLGTAWSSPLLHRFLAGLLLALGRVDDAAAEAEAGLRVARRLDAPALSPALLGVLGRVALLRGDRAAARAYVDRGRDLAGDGPGLVAVELRWRRLLLGPPPAAVQGRLSGAPERAGDEPPWGGVLAYLVVQEPWEAVRLRAVPGVRECLRDLARRNPGVASLVAAAAHAEGRLEEAVELYRTAPRPLGLAAALEEAGRHAEAREVYAACGLTGRPTSGLAGGSAGGGEAGGGGQRVDRRGWEALTGAELRVVRLVAQGMTNREVAAALFLSPHTVDSHLRHAFAKLGVNSRVELTRQVLAHDHPD
ncbi:ATP-binding protein [Nonomuraea maritima]|uniref:ATP-binding protein n=1 Tax=Nonomuraea maritima TaxID=683260 RepID=UPI0037202C61